MGSGRVSGGCNSFMKWSLFLVNLLCLLAGAAIAGFGGWMLADQMFMEDLLGSSLYRLSAILFIVSGSIVFIISIFGCMGAIKESRCLLNTYGCLLLLIFIILVSAGILALVFNGEFTEGFDTTLEEALSKYYDDEGVAQAWDDTHQILECCGIDGPQDWAPDPIPDSCYEEGTENRIPNILNTNLYKDGCMTKLKEVLTDNAVILSAIAISVGVIMLIGIIFSLALAGNVGKR